MVRSNIYIMVNSPGEIAGWAAPVVRELRLHLKSCCITLVVPPCQYASGAETEYGSQLEGVDSCVRFCSALFSDIADPDAACLVLHLGGDFAYSVLLSRRLRAPLYAYAARPRWGACVEHFFVPDHSAERRFALSNFLPDRYSKVGHLALDSVVLKETEEETRLRLGFAPQQKVLAFLTGSRPLEYCEGMPFFVKIASLVTESFPDHEVIFPMAPTVEEPRLREALDAKGVRWRGSSRIREVDLGGGRWGRVLWGLGLESINCCRLVVAVPGTNNLQVAALYVPLLMVLPLDKAEEYPLDGIGGVLPLWLPGVKRLKRWIIFRMNKRVPFVSLPNRMAGRMIAPELRGLLTAEDVAAKAKEMLASPQTLEEISRSFWELTHERGAAGRIASAVIARLKR